jgi:effector-binding domain-containing protein
MELKTIFPMHVLCFETQTTLQQMIQYVRVVAYKMYQAAVQNELEITGPVYWIYEGMDGNPETVFSLTIALPVTFKNKELNNSEFKLKKLETFHCASEQHHGDWSKLVETYDYLIPEIISGGLAMSGQNREIYLHMDFENPEANNTEIQIGITEHP